MHPHTEETHSNHVVRETEDGKSECSVCGILEPEFKSEESAEEENGAD